MESVEVGQQAKIATWLVFVNYQGADDTVSWAKQKLQLVVVATNFYAFKVTAGVDADADGNGSATGITVLNIFLPTRRNVDAAGITFAAIGALDRLLNKHKRKCSSGFSDRQDRFN